jgi:hypothetical protein
VKDAVHFVMWLFIGALVVLVVTHAQGFATATNAVGGQLTNDAYLLSGGASGPHASAPGSWGKSA